MSHHLNKTHCASCILKDTQCAGLCREDCKLHGDALAANGVFQNYMSMHQAVASRLRRGRQNRPIRLCGCSKSEKEKDTFKTHTAYGPPVLDADCRLQVLPAAMLYHRISAAASENADRSVTDPKWDLLSGFPLSQRWAGLTIPPGLRSPGRSRQELSKLLRLPP